MAGLYSVDGKINVTVVTGSSYTGIYAPDGSINVVIDDVLFRGAYHPCGALRMSSSTGVTEYDPSGAFYSNHLLGPGAISIGPPTGDGTMDFSLATGDDTGLLALLEDI